MRPLPHPPLGDATKEGTQDGSKVLAMFRFFFFFNVICFRVQGQRFWGGFLLFKIICLFTFGCARSLLLCGFFSSCGARASHCGGFMCCGARAVGHAGLSGCGARAQT